LALQPRPSSQSFIGRLVENMIAAGILDDPLLAFTGQLKRGRQHAFGETVDLAGLFSCGGAVADELTCPVTAAERLRFRLVHGDAVVDAARSSGWEPLLPAPRLRSGILLLEGRDRDVRAAPAEELRAGFQRHGVAVTTYPGGLARISLLS